MPALLRLDTISKHYDASDTPALQSVSLAIEPGEFVALMGPSGCGKSTLLNIMGAIDTASTGHVWFETLDLSLQNDTGLTQLRQTQIGFIFQFFNLLPTLTVTENIALPLNLSGSYSKKQVDEKVSFQLARLGIAHRASVYPAQISGGEMQRAAIARALIHQPKLILADEPTGNLDSENGKHVLALLQSFCKENGQTVVMATHSQEAVQFADRVVQMKDGQIVLDTMNAAC